MYYLTNGIYTKWTTLCKLSMHQLVQIKEKIAMKQEACQKNLERAFGVLQSRFAIAANPNTFLEQKGFAIYYGYMHNNAYDDHRG